MTVGAEGFFNNVACKVEIEDKCGGELEASDLKKVDAADCNGGSNGVVNVSGNGKDDSSYAFVGGGVEVIADDPSDTGSLNVIPKSDPADKVEELNKEQLGIENGGGMGFSLGLQIHESTTAKNFEVKVVNEPVDLNNGFTVDSANGIIAQNSACQITREEGVAFSRTNELEHVNGMTNEEAEKDGINSEITVDSESTPTPIESSSLTVITNLELESTPKPTENSNSQAKINQSVSTPYVIKAVDEFHSTPNPLSDGSESVCNVINEAECQVPVEGSESCKPTEDTECQVTEKGSESLGNSIEKREFQVSVDGSESLGNSIDIQECEAPVDEFKYTCIPTENAAVSVTVIESAKELEKCKEPLQVNESSESVELESAKIQEIMEKQSKIIDENKESDTVVTEKVECEAPLITKNNSAEGTDCGIEIESLAVPDEEQTEIIDKDAPVRGHSLLIFPSKYTIPETVIQFGSFGLHENVPNIPHNDMNTLPEVLNGETESTCGANSNNHEQNLDSSQGDRSGNKVTCDVQNNGFPTSSVEGSLGDAIDGQNDESPVPPYNFLPRIPRFDDANLKDQIKNAQLQVDEKTEQRDAIWREIQATRAKLKAQDEALNAAKLELTTARQAVVSKRKEIDSLQHVINRVKNAHSVEDCDNKISNMEHRIQHETLSLKEEKQLIRDIKQIKNLRDQLASNMATPDEIQQTLSSDQKDQTEEHLKNLRKELNSVKSSASKAESTAITMGKEYGEGKRSERELQVQFRAADDVRQKAYVHLKILKKQLYDKSKAFYKYKEDLMAAKDFASRGDKASLHRLCANQVETFMEQWNRNDEFRKEYISMCKTNEESRRKRTLNEVSKPEPLASTSVEIEQKGIISSVEDKKTDHESSKKNVSKKKKKVAAKTNEVPEPSLKIELATTVNGSVMEEEEEKTTMTREEMELAKEAEELRKQEEEAELKEKRRLEEKAKQIEALKRKKIKEEKAQKKAELQAQKEAEKKEKEREKRMMKKERKRGGSINGDDCTGSECSSQTTVKEIEAVNESHSRRPHNPRAHVYSKQLKPKPIPPQIVNRNKRLWQRWQQWLKLLMVVAVLIALFLLGNTSFFRNLRLLN